MDEMRPDLDEIRSEIDRIDAELVRLLNERVDLAKAIGALKGRDGKPFFTPERERQIYEKLSSINQGPLQRQQLIRIFREIISAARAAEKPLQVAYWGPEGSFTHLAAMETFGSSSNFLAMPSIEETFLAVEHGRADYGVAPIENSTAGVVPETLDMFPQTNVRICAETFIPIQMHLASLASSLKEIERVYSGPQPVGQCARWLASNLQNVEIIDVVPTSRAAQMAAGDAKGAAICNRLAAETSGLPLLSEHIQDHAHNSTRFLVIGFNEPAKTDRDKTSIMFVLRNRPGELYRALGAFVNHGVNLLMIESRPAKRASFEYIFYCDCAGHRTDESIQAAMSELKSLALEATLLGSYPTNDPSISNLM